MRLKRILVACVATVGVSASIATSTEVEDTPGAAADVSITSCVLYGSGGPVATLEILNSTSQTALYTIGVEFEGDGLREFGQVSVPGVVRLQVATANVTPSSSVAWPEDEKVRCRIDSVTRRPD